MSNTTIHTILVPINDYLWSINKNTENNTFELEIGIPNSWIYNNSPTIGCKLKTENKIGKLLTIYPLKDDIYIDELISFVELLINTNNMISDKEKEFEKTMEDMKKVLEDKAKIFYKELDDIKVNSFNSPNAIEIEKPKDEDTSKTNNSSSDKIIPNEKRKSKEL